jgi:2-oxoglutarate ferredoxin oxidoreductase subunit alpha
MTQSTWSVAIIGSGGSGSVTTGLILMEALARRGLYAMMTRSYGPQIRGGESAVMIRFGNRPVQAPSDAFDLLLALDWLKVDRFLDELPLTADSRIVCEQAGDGLPPAIAAQTGEILSLPLQQEARAIPGGRANMLGLGVLAAWIGLSAELLRAAVGRSFRHKGEDFLRAAEAGIERGRALFQAPLQALSFTSERSPTARWNISGNEACGLGALRGGIRFVAAYPITPASEMLEWLAPRLEKLGGLLLQAEDELASVNMAIGASFGGVPAMTATSGPGLSLMAEGMGLAVASETPILVVNVNRGGPSTGIPTKSEQSDLNLALYGLHGDAPHLLLAPLDIGDAVFTTQWAAHLAEHLQTLALVLSDQMLGQARCIIDPPPERRIPYQRQVAGNGAAPYRRYSTQQLVSPMSLPGQADCQYTADGLEHNRSGRPSSIPQDHAEQADKRLRKLLEFDYGEDWAVLDGDGELALITWGSTHAAVREAAERLRADGMAVRTLSLRLLAPLPVDAFRRACDGVRRALVVELNQGGQCYHLLRSQSLLPAQSDSLCRVGPLPFRPAEIYRHCLELWGDAS